MRPWAILSATLLCGSATLAAVAPYQWKVRGSQVGGLGLGAVAGLGDTNHDGYDDLLVGAFGLKGKAFLFLGSAAGPATIPSWSAEGDAIHAMFGRSTSRAGDVNGDGAPDALIGGPAYSGHPGTAFLFTGSASGLSASAAWSASPSSTCFCKVAGAGNVNGDAFNDGLIGDGFNGKAYLYRGTFAGLSTVPIWTASPTTAFDYGVSLDGAGDVDGDGFGDVIVGADDFEFDATSTVLAPHPGKAFVYRGTATGLSASPSWVLQGDQDFGWFGFAVAGVGDVNQDGYDDVVVGAYCQGPSCTGRASLYLGSAAGLSTSPAWTAQGEQLGAHFGVAVAEAGDVNGDGYDDVLVSAVKDVTLDQGHVYLYLGSPTGLSSSSAWDSTGEVSTSDYGRTLGGAGDVDGDGLDDIAVGAEDYPNGQDQEGAAYLYLGSRLCLDRDHDGYGSPGVSTCPAGASADCSDSDPSAHPGAVEVCDGHDNDCNGTLDDAPVPGGSPAVVGQTTQPDPLFSWPVLPGATGYDVVRGDLALLRSSGGDFSVSILNCAANDTPTTQVQAGGIPAAGNAWFYVVRGVNCGGAGSYDEGAAQQGSRDAEIAASPQACL
jgi:hypothetical protein